MRDEMRCRLLTLLTLSEGSYIVDIPKIFDIGTVWKLHLHCVPLHQISRVTVTAAAADDFTTSGE